MTDGTTLENVVDWIHAELGDAQREQLKQRLMAAHARQTAFFRTFSTGTGLQAAVYGQAVDGGIGYLQGLRFNRQFAAACQPLIDEVCQDLTEAAGVRQVQIMLPEHARDRIATLERCQFVRLASLKLLVARIAQATLPMIPSVPKPITLEVLRGDEVEREQLIPLIEDTFVESHDCPSLFQGEPQGIESHQLTAITERYHGLRWLLARQGGAWIGCLCLGDESPATSEVVYLGIRPAFRRQGYGRYLLAHAFHLCSQQQDSQLLVEVDAQNNPAILLYRQLGFHDVSSRLLLAR